MDLPIPLRPLSLTILADRREPQLAPEGLEIPQSTR